MCRLQPATCPVQQQCPAVPELIITASARGLAVGHCIEHVSASLIMDTPFLDPPMASGSSDSVAITCLQQARQAMLTAGHCLADTVQSGSAGLDCPAEA